MKRILVGLDGTEDAEAAVTHALGLARSSASRVRIVRAVQRPREAPPPLVELRAPEVLRALADAESALRAQSLRIPQAMRDGVVAEIGMPVDVLRRAAASQSSDVVVVSAPLAAELQRAAHGEAWRLFDCPLRIVPDGQAEALLAAPHSHAVRNATMLAGAASGATVGIAGGPAGMMLGGLVGSAMGALAGRVLERADAARVAHDHDLDDAIGVTRGALGAAEVAADALTASERRARGLDGEDTRAGDIFRREHARLDELGARLYEALSRGEGTARAAWLAFAPALRAIIALEREELLPGFRIVDAEEADVLAGEHALLLARAESIGAALERREVPLGDLVALVGLIREHLARKDVLLYPWADRLLDVGVLQRHAQGRKVA